jgi:hypothetical protein
MASVARRSIAHQQSGVLHPLRRLPEEILIQIFERCADEEAQGWFEGYWSVTPNPKVPTRIAGVCRRWRGIALGCPRLWRRILAPAHVTRRVYNRSDTVERGIDHFRRALRLCEGAQLELTLPARFTFPRDVDITTLEVRRLSILDASQTWPSMLPSPKHLWLGQVGQPATNLTLSREILLSVISNTSQITSSSISLTFASPVSTVTHLVLCGQHATLPLNDLLCSLPQLVILDAKDARLSNRPRHPVLVQPNTHSQLRTFGVNGTGLGFLEQALIDGLRLPKLRLFEIANIGSGHLATNYPSIPTHMSRHITHVGILGTCGVTGGALRAFIDIFPHLDTLSLHGAVTELALQALYHAASSDGDDGGLKCSLPRTVQSVMIWDYQGDGEAIHQQLHAMRAGPAPNGESIKIIFEDCPNIRLDIRKELC